MTRLTREDTVCIKNVTYKYIIFGTVYQCQVFSGTLCQYNSMITITDIQPRLREAIKNSGKTQKQIADELGISQFTVSKYMRANKFPSLETFANLCEVLDVSADDILGIRK